MATRRMRRRFQKHLVKYERRLVRLDTDAEVADFVLEDSHNFQRLCLNMLSDLVIEVDRLATRITKLEKR